MAEELRYTVVIEQADGSFSVHVPDLPGCVSSGDTREEALEMIREAIRGHLEGPARPRGRCSVAAVDGGGR